MMTLMVGAEDEILAETAMGRASRLILSWEKNAGENGQLQVIGPVNAPVYKLNDIFRKIIYMKSENYAILIQIRNRTEELLQQMDEVGKVNVQFDFC